MSCRFLLARSGRMWLTRSTLLFNAQPLASRALCSAPQLSRVRQGLVPATPLGRDRAFQYQVNSARFLSTSGGSNGDDDNDEKKKKSNEEDSEEAKDEKEDKEKESGDEEDTPAGTLEIVSVSHDEPGEVTLGASTRGPNFSPALKRVPAYYPEVVVIPISGAPLFPEFMKYLEIEDKTLIRKLRSIVKARQPYAGVFLRKDDSNPQSSVIDISQVNSVGTFVSIEDVTTLPNNRIGVFLRGHRRITLTDPIEGQESLTVKVNNLSESDYDRHSQEIKALSSEIVKTIRDIVQLNPLYRATIQQIMEMGIRVLENPAHLGDFGASLSTTTGADIQAVLNEVDVQKRLTLTLELLKREYIQAKLQAKIRQDVEEKVNKQRRTHMLHEQLHAIKKELGIVKEDKDALLEKYRKLLKDVQLPEAAKKVIDDEMMKLDHLESSSADYNVTRNYLDWLTGIPWDKYTQESFDIEKASKILDEDHYGMKDVKDRVVEFIAVGSLLNKVHGKIICFVGPPGVGKTRSIAKALNRKYFRFSVGGLHDVAEIKGHRRTYVGAMPGKLIQSLKQTQSLNPLILIDEIDKIGRGHNGDPTSALLELLDPEQNVGFLDHYLDVPVDMSKALFVCTANVTDTIPGPLLDRMEVIQLSGYLQSEKRQIAEKYLIPHAKETTGIPSDKVVFGEGSIDMLIRNYCRESGVRNLQKHIEKILRKAAVQLVQKTAETVEITPSSLTSFVGNPVFVSDRMYDKTPAGVVMGLAWTSMGGTSLYIETVGTKNPDKEKSGGGFRVTGQLGEVMKESSTISYINAKRYVEQLQPGNSYFYTHDINLHVPEGATPKDGPSAGVTMTTALLSLACGKPVKQALAMTGEISLTGKVLRVGGIKEKLLAAKRSGVTLVLLPAGNEADYKELTEDVRRDVEVKFVETYEEVLKHVFEDESK